MLWVVLTVAAALVGGGCLVVLIGGGPTRRFGALAIAAGTGVVWLVASVAMSVHTVGQRQVGIVYNFSGTISGKVDPGIAWTAPWQHIKKENVGLQRESFDLDSGNSAVSSDQQPIFAKVTLNYQVQPSQVVELFKTVGPAWKVTLLDSRVLQDFKEVTAGFTAQQITTSREQLRAATKTRLAGELKKYDINVIDFFVTNIDYAQSYKNAISAKNVQVQKSLQADAKVRQATAEANQAIATAKGEAQAIRLKGRALHDNPEVLQLEAIDKLNPNASVIICTGTGSGNCPSFLPQVAAKP
jgi:prohibitin 2